MRRQRLRNVQRLGDDLFSPATGGAPPTVHDAWDDEQREEVRVAQWCQRIWGPSPTTAVQRAVVDYLLHGCNCCLPSLVPLPAPPRLTREGTPPVRDAVPFEPDAAACDEAQLALATAEKVEDILRRASADVPPWFPPEQRPRVAQARIHGFNVRPPQSVGGMRVAAVAEGAPRDVRSARLYGLV